MNARELIERLVDRELELYAGPDILEEQDIWATINDIQFMAHQIRERWERGELTMEKLHLSSEKVSNFPAAAEIGIGENWEDGL